MASPRLTLRLRLVLALTVLMVVGLAIFGFATYSLYARSERQRLDDQITASIPLVQAQLYQQAGLDDGHRPDAGGPRRPAAEAVHRRAAQHLRRAARPPGRAHLGHPAVRQHQPTRPPGRR